MDKKNWMELLSGKAQLTKVLSMNEKTAGYGLALTKEQAELLLADRKDSLREKARVEFGEGILPGLIETFCDSPYINQENYVETIGRLQDIFYQYKNDSMDTLTDDELLSFMEQAFNGECQGSADYLEETILEQFARDIRIQGEQYLYRMRRRRAVEDEEE